MFTEIVNIIANAAPYMQVLHDSGFYAAFPTWTERVLTAVGIDSPFIVKDM